MAKLGDGNGNSDANSDRRMYALANEPNLIEHSKNKKRKQQQQHEEQHYQQQMTASRRKRARESVSEIEHKESVLKNVMLSRVGNAGSSSRQQQCYRELAMQSQQKQQQGNSNANGSGQHSSAH